VKCNRPAGGSYLSGKPSSRAEAPAVHAARLAPARLVPEPRAPLRDPRAASCTGPPASRPVDPGVTCALPCGYAELPAGPPAPARPAGP